MAKILVKANEDFFDRVNQSVRKKGNEFVLKSEYAESLQKKVMRIGEATTQATPVVAKEPGKPRDMDRSRIKRAVKRK